MEAESHLSCCKFLPIRAGVHLIGLWTVLDFAHQAWLTYELLDISMFMFVWNSLLVFLPMLLVAASFTEHFFDQQAKTRQVIKLMCSIVVLVQFTEFLGYMIGCLFFDTVKGSDLAVIAAKNVVTIVGFFYFRNVCGKWQTLGLDQQNTLIKEGGRVR